MDRQAFEAMDRDAVSGTLMRDVDRLVNNALPVDYDDLTGLGEGDGTDEDIMDFLVPPEDEDSSIFSTREKKGADLC
jgi:hypothetical protein